MLKLLISSGGRVLGRLDLPLALDEFKRKVEEIRKAGQPNSTPAVFGADCPIPVLNRHLRQTWLDSDATLRKLNQLAEVIGGMSTAAHYHLSKALSTDYKQSLDDMLQAAVHIEPAGMDCYEIVPEAARYQDLGKWLVEHDGLAEKVPEMIRPYLDYYSIGEDYCNAHEGKFLAVGYVGIRTEAMERMREKQMEYGSIRPAGESSPEGSSQGFQMGGPV